MKRISLFTAIVLGLVMATTNAADASAWKKRSVYQLLTDRFAKSSGDTSGCNLSNYCGGDFEGVKKNLQYIKDLGFDAIWISPVVDNLDGGYHGYWARNWNAINSHFGDADALKRLVDAAHSMDIWVMVDVVGNHVAPIGNDFGQISPFNSGDHYHSNCDINDWNNQWQVENCRLSGLPDLKQENGWVRQQLKDWIKNLVQTYNFDGIRIDTIPEVPKDFWTEFGQSAGVFQMGECFNGNPAYVGDYQNHVTGLFNYPMYYTIKDTWQSQRSMRGISDRWTEESSKFRDVDALGIFVDNHDNSRFLNGKNDNRQFKSALAFSLTARGIPFMYYGSEQGFAGGNDPNNREPIWANLNKDHENYKFVQTIMNARKSHNMAGSAFQEKWADDDFYAYTRGNTVVALTNKPDQGINRNVPNLGISNGMTLCNIFNQSDCQTVQNNSINVNLNNGEVKIYAPKSSSNDEIIQIVQE